ncbi:MAG: hypothetical protein MRY74_12940 [Neomegalonema sp.]|nr:hypothetical protein [Neomegalonema sp.]
MDAAIEIRPNRFYLGLAMLGCVGFVLLGLWAIFLSDRGVDALVIGVLSVGFFGFVLIRFTQFLVRGGRRGLRLTAEGLWIYGAGRSPKLAAWRDIEALGVYAVGNQKFNVITLAAPEAYVAQFSEAEAREAASQMRWLQRFAGAASVASLGAHPELNAAAGASWRELAGVLAWNRDMYGGEITLGWADRDRSAAALDALLREWGGRAAERRAQSA